MKRGYFGHGAGWLGNLWNHPGSKFFGKRFSAFCRNTALFLEVSATEHGSGLFSESERTARNIVGRAHAHFSRQALNFPKSGRSNFIPTCHSIRLPGTLCQSQCLHHIGHNGASVSVQKKRGIFSRTFFGFGKPQAGNGREASSVKSACQSGSLADVAIRGSRVGRNRQRYAERTADYAFGPAGDRDLERNERYRELWRRVEGMGEKEKNWPGFRWR